MSKITREQLKPFPITTRRVKLGSGYSAYSFSEVLVEETRGLTIYAGISNRQVYRPELNPELFLGRFSKTEMKSYNRMVNGYYPNFESGWNIVPLSLHAYCQNIQIGEDVIVGAYQYGQAPIANLIDLDRLVQQELPDVVMEFLAEKPEVYESFVNTKVLEAFALANDLHTTLSSAK